MFSVYLEIPDESFLSTEVRKKLLWEVFAALLFGEGNGSNLTHFRLVWFLCIFFKMNFTFLNYDCLFTNFFNWLIDLDLLSKIYIFNNQSLSINITNLKNFMWDSLTYDTFVWREFEKIRIFNLPISL